jgi:hypothetical protein
VAIFWFFKEMVLLGLENGFVEFLWGTFSRPHSQQTVLAVTRRLFLQEPPHKFCGGIKRHVTGDETMKEITKKWPVLLTVLMFIAGCTISVNNNNPTAQYSKAFQYASTDSSFTGISINNVNGTIEVVGVDSLSGIQVSGEKKVTDQTETEAENHIGDISVEMDSSGNTFSIITHQPTSGGNRNYEVDYKIHIPIGWKVAIVNINGDITVTNISDDVSVTVTNGMVSTNSVTGNLETVIQNGNINADVVLPSGDACDLNTTNGQIILTVPRSTSATVTASVVNGTVSISNLPIVETSTSETHITGTIGKGESSISLNAVNGTIELNGK